MSKIQISENPVNGHPLSKGDPIFDSPATTSTTQNTENGKNQSIELTSFQKETANNGYPRNTEEEDSLNQSTRITLMEDGEDENHEDGHPEHHQDSSNRGYSSLQYADHQPDNEDPSSRFRSSDSDSDIEVPDQLSNPDIYQNTEWGNTRRLFSIFCTTVQLGPGCEPITPAVLITVSLVLWYLLNNFITSVEHPAYAVWLLASVEFFLVFVIFFTSFTDPGHIHRKKDQKLLDKYGDEYYCRKCMVTYKEARKYGIVHCYDCGRCTIGYDHHCPVLGNCIGKKNLWSFYSIIGAFILAVMTAYYVMFLIILADTNLKRTVVKVAGSGLKKAMGAGDSGLGDIDN